MFSMLDFIEDKRDGKVHGTADLQMFVDAVRDHSVPDYQVAAWLMAVFFQGLSVNELTGFTRSVAFSGDIVKIPDGRAAVDKHSTGGVGDKTTLVVAPLVAACGVNVAKLSGRGLGFTGGTVDKLESVPGMDMHLSAGRFIDQIMDLGIALSGHSLQLAPAEGDFYRLRDVTGTVPSLPLIASSIVSKKIAGGSDAFVFDVKCGSGAFMQTYPEAEELARTLVELSAALGKKSACLISDMEQPLGEWVGNSMEVFEAIEVLSGRGPEDTKHLSIALAAEMLVLAEAASDVDAAVALAGKTLRSGAALDKFAQVISAQGGDASVCDDPGRVLPMAVFQKEIVSGNEGFVERVDAKAVGCAVRALGGGRFRKEDDIDTSVSMRLLKKVGDPISRGEPLATVGYNTERQLLAALPYAETAYAVGSDSSPRRLLLGRIS